MKRKRCSYFFDNISFPSRVKLQEHIRNRLNNIYDKRRNNKVEIRKDENGDDFSFLMELLDKHPERDEKIGTGVYSFIIMTNRLNKRGLELHVRRTDLTQIDFSWHACTGKKKSDPLISAMRQTIAPETLSFKCNSILNCAECNVDNIPFSDYDVDHKTKSFDNIATDFLTDCSLPRPSDFASHPKYNMPIFTQDDKDFEEEWREYHNNHADYQLLCFTCNRSKGKTL